MRRFVRLHFLFLLTFGVSIYGFGQTAPGSHTASSAELFEPLDLPEPNLYRTASGAPGPAYWQQRADYKISVNLDPSTHRVSGTVKITYTNNSPDTLGFLWLQLDQNLFSPESRGASLNSGRSRWRGAIDEGGFEITRVEVARQEGRESPGYFIDDTRMRVTLGEPLPPGGSTLDLEIDFSFVVPPYGADRMGRLDVSRGTVYQLAQWYPRMAVYDDVNGWNTLPYLGQGEFYLEYGDFEVEITVPRDFVVVATGMLQNEEDVLTAEQRARLEEARKSAETVFIARPEEVGTAAYRPDGDEPLTWRFRAENVRDFAWAASQAFIWDAASWEDVLVMSAYPHEGLGDGADPTRPGWEKSTEYVRHSISYYSGTWYRYPYPVAINVAGIVGGMEYPMIVFCSVRARGQALFDVTDHEIGHFWFPMIVGNDERRHAWMDEGFDTFINYYSTVAYYGADENTENDPSSFTGAMLSRASQQPVYTGPDRIQGGGLGLLAYYKPAAALMLLREHVLGEERFDTAFREYIRRWAFKHPQPADFFRTMESVAGEDLDWFWRGWIFGTGRLDQAIEAVTSTADGTSIRVANLGGVVMPAELSVTLTDGRDLRFTIPVETWATGNQTEVQVPATGIVRAVLDPEGKLPDINRNNNLWTPSPRTGTDPAPTGR